MDTSGVLTIFGLIVAVFAIIPREKILDLRIRISGVDWLVIFLAFTLVHYIIYYPVLKEIGLAFNLGQWRFGFNEENTVYLIFLCLGVYFLVRSRFSKVNRSNIEVASYLFEQLLMEEKYGELVVLTEKHIAGVANIHKSESVRNKLATLIRPIHDIEIHLGLKTPTLVDRLFSDQRLWFSELLNSNDSKKEFANNILRRLINNIGFIKYLSVSRPYLALSIIKEETFFTEDFVNNLMRSLIENQASIFYYELEHTNELLRSNRYKLSVNNKLLYYFFYDVRVSEKLGIYKPVGDMVCEFLDYDVVLIAKYNEPLGTYYERDRFRCPIYSSVHFFDVMLLESMHQGIRWHMWLYYLPSFVEKILKNLMPSPQVDMHAEWPTPFHYNLYNIVKVMIYWLEEVAYVDNKEPLQIDNEGLHHDNGSIPKSTVLALGNIVFQIINSNSVSNDFKEYICEVVFQHTGEVVNDPLQKQLNQVLLKSIIRNGFYNNLNYEYVEKLSDCYQNIDHVIRHDNEDFSLQLNEAQAELGMFN